MKTTLTTLILLFLISSCGSKDEEVIDPPKPTMDPPKYAMWEIDALTDSLEIANSDHFTFLEEASMRGEYLELHPGDPDTRVENNLDKLYYIQSGDGVLSVDTTEQQLVEGLVIFVKAGTSSKVIQINTSLNIVIVSLKTPSQSSAPKWQAFSKSEIEAPRNPNSNVWNPFVNFQNVILGMYMLPANLGGDGRLVHNWDELNIISSGSSKFKMDDAEIDVKPGSIVFVKKSNGHFFKSLNSDIDILIFWNQP